MRIFVAFLVAPLVIAISWPTYAFLSSKLSSGPLSERLLEFLVFVVMVYSGATTFTVILALPLFLLLRRLDLVRSWTTALAGVAIGGMAGAFLGNMTTPLGVLALSVLGGVAGLVFWHVGGFNTERQY